jgi:hypothetical protein
VTHSTIHSVPSKEGYSQYDHEESVDKESFVVCTLGRILKGKRTDRQEHKSLISPLSFAQSSVGFGKSIQNIGIIEVVIFLHGTQGKDWTKEIT